jgi:hypothetical protein
VHIVNRWSFVVGVVAILCALPIVAQIVQRYRTHGTLEYPALYRLVAVPLLYIVTRYAERRM